VNEIDTCDRHRDKHDATGDGYGKTNTGWDGIGFETGLFDHDTSPLLCGRKRNRPLSHRRLRSERAPGTQAK